ncbi:unnamed protein product [Trifolium pratense]|uniref:Uncharacterized protein n=1 Tax=Trifolium pratense TaxID=57577 RepID=A0ACB0LYJ1_TRIPR|nr:unnamed protein product [Trifolium pratense]
MEILVSVVEKVADSIFVPIGRQASYVIFYKGNFKKLAAHVVRLEAERERMVHSIEEERGNGKEIERDVVNWLEKVNEVIEKANQLQKDPRRSNARCSTWQFPNLILRHQLSRKATKIVIDVVQVQGKGMFDRVGYLPILDGVASSSAKGGENYETRELLKEDIVKALEDLNSCIIGVYGLGGVGKTTLVEEVAQISKQRKLFDKVVKTHVSKNADFKTIQGEIADSLGLRFDEETIYGRANRLRQRIMMEKSILVILDNIWTMLDLKKIGIPFGNEHNGCKLLMTCRNQDVLLQMDVPKNFTFKLELMSENETWNLFKFMAGDVVEDKNLKDVPFQVAQKCEGLPLRVVTVARAMRNKRDIQSWKEAWRKLQSNDQTEMEALTYSALELSYNSLESDEMRDIFLLFSLLPGNDVEYFLKVAVGLNILKHVNTMDDARNKLYTIIKSLEATCLLLEVKTSENIKMHDFVRDFATSIARRDKHVFLIKQPNDDWPTKDSLKRCTQIFLDRFPMHMLPPMFDCPNIKFFCLSSENRSLEIPDNFFEGMGSLTVLDLTSLNLSSLPTSFRFLTNLKTLCLYFCVLENMDAIEALKNLQILNLWKSSMTKLPREIGKLTQLRMLDLSDSGIEVVPSNIISNLTKLEELYMGNTSINWEDVNSIVQTENASISELQKLPNLTALELQIRETWMLPRDLQLMFEKLEKYKIAIGNVWEWSDIKDGTSKTLMLKLGTNIHLEHAIKALIRSVEKLYLDDVDGIQNVLYQLNGEGFPLLKYLHVQNNANMKHIVDSKERNRIHVSFPILETLVLHNLKNLEHICHGPLSITSFGSLSVIKVKNCIQLKYIFSSTMVKGLSSLSEIDVCRCDSMKEIVLEDNRLSANNEKIEFLQLRSLTLEHLEMLDNFFSYYSTDSSPFFNALVAFPNLDNLKLSSLNLNNIWNDNLHSMHNLTSLIVDNCDGLKYLFSSSVVGSFKNLKHLEISNCAMMEEIIAKEEGNNASKEVHFLKLEKIILKDMDNLKSIWHCQFETLKMLQVNNCNKIAVVFPSSLQKTYNKLEMLEITDCSLVEEIFELNFNGSSSVEDTTHLKEVTIDGLHKLKKIWSGDPQGILSFQNLINVKLNNCEGLEYLLPLSVATRCSHLKELHLKFCGNMKEIVAEEKESISVNAAPLFEFNKLSTLLLWHLGKLKGFYAKNHALACPSLKEIDVVNCEKLNLYRPLYKGSSNFQEDKLFVLMQQPPFIVEEVIPNLEKLRIDHKDANIILQAQNSSGLFTKLTFLGLSAYKNEDTFPYWFLQNMRRLEALVVERSCFKKIFQDEGRMSEKTPTQIKRLTLSALPNLEHICEEGSQIDPVLEFLQILYVKECSSLINLLPYSATFSHLEYMEIISCNGLKKLLTSPTTQSLDKLSTLKVKECNSLEEIITGEENIHITFISLQILMLESLPSLKQFCSSKCFFKFPLLEVVIVKECPCMEVFSEGYISTPNLRKVKIAENDEEWFWKGNINDTITSMFEDKVTFGSFKHLKLSEHPELKELWCGQLQLHNVFRSLKYLVVHKCDFLSEALFQPNLLEVLRNLEELDVKDCNSLQAVFDFKGEFGKEIDLVKNSTRLKKLKLSNLPKLKHVWKEDPHNTMRFQSLSEVFVEECKSLLRIFPLSVARDMMKLQIIDVRDCGIEEIVGKDEIAEVVEIVKFVYPHLTSIILTDLTELKAFFLGVHSLECKSLKMIDMFGCPKLYLFKIEPFRQQENAINDKLNISTHQPLFVIEEVFNMEKLNMNIKYFDMILHSKYSEVQFNKANHIGVSEFYNDEEAIFPYWFLKNVPNLQTILVQWSSFKEIFQGEQLVSKEKKTEIIPRLKELKLWYLNKLQCIWKERFEMDPVLYFLERMIVAQCSSLIKLVPSSATFKNMTYLEVANCNGLINLITYATAKSLVKLTTMKIAMCDSIEDIVNGEEDETNEIVFCSLQSLELISLPRLCRFCSCPCPIMFPLLEVVVVTECPRMEHFSLGVTDTPNLQNIQIEENDEENRWVGDLNGTVKKLFDDKVAFRKFKYLALSDYPELKSSWYGQLENDVFCNLKHLVVHNCDFLSHVLFPSNVMQVLHGLEELEVRNCDSLEAVFDVKGMKSAEEILIKQSTQLKKLTLSNLPKLNHIWNEDPREIISFGNLCTVNVSICQSLIYIFSLSLCEDLGHLEILEIESCGVLEIVAMEEGTMENSFKFPQLNKLVLGGLINLVSFYGGKHSLDCPSLKVLDVYYCGVLRNFSFDNLDFQRSLFSIEKVSPNLTELAITGIDLLEILNQENIFQQVQILRLQYLDETPTTFLNEYSHTKFPNLETFQVRNSSFETLFPTTGYLRMQISKQIKYLGLRDLEMLKHIWQDDFPLDHPLLEDLEELCVWDCPSLISLVPSSTSFKNLTYLQVDKCKELVYLITTSTAETLIHLVTLKIMNCEKMLDVVKIDEERAEKNIIFENLKYLELTSLSSLDSFCYENHTFIFPSLLLVTVKECPKMEIFSSGVTVAPYLTKIEVGEKTMRWKGDINTTIQHLFLEKL